MLCQASTALCLVTMLFQARHVLLLCLRIAAHFCQAIGRDMCCLFISETLKVSSRWGDRPVYIRRSGQAERLPCQGALADSLSRLQMLLQRSCSVSVLSLQAVGGS